MIDLAVFESKGRQQRVAIAERQGVPLDFMDHILQKLRSHDLVKTVRGRGGGLVLARPSLDITAWDIVCAVEDFMTPVQCLEETCGNENDCQSKEAWAAIYTDIANVLKSRKLSSMINSDSSGASKTASMPRECRGPRKKQLVLTEQRP